MRGMRVGAPVAACPHDSYGPSLQAPTYVIPERLADLSVLLSFANPHSLVQAVVGDQEPAAHEAGEQPAARRPLPSAPKRHGAEVLARHRPNLHNEPRNVHQAYNW